MAATISKEDATSLMRYVNSQLIVKQLQHVLKMEGQPTSGLKAPLQRRLITCKIPEQVCCFPDTDFN
jgi:hypothetical protein